MIYLKIIRTYQDLRDGSSKRRMILFVRNKSLLVAKKMLSLMKNNMMLEGDDRIVLQSGSNVKEDYKICMICCRRAQQRNKHICHTCGKQPGNSEVDSPSKLDLAQKTTPPAIEKNNSTAKSPFNYYKFHFGVCDEEYNSRFYKNKLPVLNNLK